MVCFVFKQKTAYEMRISDWSSDVCSSDLGDVPIYPNTTPSAPNVRRDNFSCGWLWPTPSPARSVIRTVLAVAAAAIARSCIIFPVGLYAICMGFAQECAIGHPPGKRMRKMKRSEEHTSELQSQMRTSYAVF